MRFCKKIGVFECSKPQKNSALAGRRLAAASSITLCWAGLSAKMKRRLGRKAQGEAQSPLDGCEIFDELDEAAERLQMRCDSDGLIVALRQIMKQQGWSPRELTKQIAVHGREDDGGGRGVAAQLQQLNTSSISLAQLKAWAQRSNIAYTESGLAFLAQYAGSDLKKLQGGQSLIADRLVYAFDRVPETPLNI